MCKTSLIRKPLAVVSLGLPDLLSILVQRRAIVVDDRCEPDMEAVRVRTARRPDPPTRNCNVCNQNAPEVEPQEFKEEPAAGPCRLRNDSGCTKPDQHARGVYRIGRGSARAPGRQALLIECACAAERRKGSPLFSDVRERMLRNLRSQN